MPSTVKISSMFSTARISSMRITVSTVSLAWVVGRGRGGNKRK
jgi:hypothetical protein